MKRLPEIFIFLLSFAYTDSLDTDVSHVIVDHKGNSIIAIVDSMDLNTVYYTNKSDNKVSTIDNLLYLVNTRNEYGDSDEISPAIMQLTEIDGIGDKVANQILEGLALRMETVLKLQTHLEIYSESKPLDIGSLSGYTFCITGTLTRSRKEIALLIKSNGGKVVTSVSKNLDYLVAGESAGSKLVTANKLGVQVIDEEQLNDMLEQDDELNIKRENTQKSLMDF